MPNFENIYRVDKFDKEFQRLFGKSKADYFRYLDQLERKLYILDDLGICATDGYVFEKLVDRSEEIYSITFRRSKNNPRVIYFINDSDIILLTAFLEKSTSDYDIGCNRAEKRVHILLKG